jgi:hypothetical protein
MGASSSSEEVSMTLTNIPPGSEKGPTEKFWRLGENLHHRTVRQFTINKWWHTPLSSVGFLTMGLLFLIVGMGCLASFPWDDSKLWEKLVMVLMISGHSWFCIVLFIESVVIWAYPYKLIFDGKGGLILRSVVRARCVAIEDIKAIVLARQQNAEESADATDICIKLSRGKLKLYRFAERKEFLKALKAANPAIVVETV